MGAYAKQRREVPPIITALTNARIALGMSQDEVAARMGHGTASGRSISLLENGHRSPTLTTLEAWARVLGHDIRLGQTQVPDIRAMAALIAGDD